MGKKDFGDFTNQRDYIFFVKPFIPLFNFKYLRW